MTESEITPEEALAVAGALDNLKRQAVADILDQLTLSGWVLRHVELGKEVSPSALARRIERSHATPLVSPGDRGTVEPSSTPSHPEGGDSHGQPRPSEAAHHGQFDLEGVPQLQAD